VKRPFRRRSVGSLIVSIAIHVALVFGLVNVVWRYPIGQLVGIRRQPPVRPERVQYIALPKPPTENSSARGQAAGRAGAPAALRAPIEVPRATPAPGDTVPTRAAGGTGTGRGVSGSGPATGIVPQLPDPRIALSSDPVERVPRSMAENVDSIIDLAIGIYTDSVAIAARQRQPGDWTVKGKDGQVWGWDKSGIRLGKYSIPNALLALLPLNAGSGRSPIETRSIEWIRRDVMENAQRTISEDEFRAAVKRIRERKERERRERQAAEQGKPIP